MTCEKCGKTTALTSWHTNGPIQGKLPVKRYQDWQCPFCDFAFRQEAIVKVDSRIREVKVDCVWILGIV